MVFADLFFLYVFLPLCLLAYGLAKDLGKKNTVLIIFSLIFYAWGEPIYVLLLLFSAAFNWFIGLLIRQFRDTTKAKIAVGVGVAVDLLLLVIFKYTGFLVENVNALFRSSIPVPSIALPIGISFFTFQAVSYILDCYWETVDVQLSFKKFLLYLSLFPQLSAGAIVRYSVVEKEIDNRSTSLTDLSEGMMRAILGLAKKVIIANNLYTIVTTFFGTNITNLSIMGSWYTVIVYSLYVYFDFSGYSDMAIGLGKMMGFNFPENFNYPYMSHSVAEFWRRWHITLGDWFKSYIYFPMGGSRKGLPRTIINLLVVWTITGIWHGASWNFMLWGAYFGILIVIERLFLGKVLEKIPSFFSWLYTFIMVVFGWVMFDAVAPGTVSFGNVFEQIWTFISAMFGGNGVFIDNTATNYIVNYGIIFAVCIFGSSDVLKTFAEYIRKKAPTWVQYGFPVVDTVIMLASVAYLSTSNYNPFLYFNF